MKNDPGKVSRGNTTVESVASELFSIAKNSGLNVADCIASMGIAAKALCEIDVRFNRRGDRTEEDVTSYFCKGYNRKVQVVFAGNDVSQFTAYSEEEVNFIIKNSNISSLFNGETRRN